MKRQHLKTKQHRSKRVHFEEGNENTEQNDLNDDDLGKELSDEEISDEEISKSSASDSSLPSDSGKEEDES
eukprot:Awhi_evm1s10541